MAVDSKKAKLELFEILNTKIQGNLKGQVIRKTCYVLRGASSIIGHRRGILDAPRTTQHVLHALGCALSYAFFNRSVVTCV
jgi:hypothetical protein